MSRTNLTIAGDRRIPKTRSVTGIAISSCFCTLAVLFGAECLAAQGELELTVLDKDTNQPVTVRAQLTNTRGRRVRPRGVRAYGNSFIVPGTIVMRLAPGQYFFEISRGPEYHLISGNLTMNSGATDNKQVVIPRFVHMKQQSWWSGDLHVELPPQDVSTLLSAEDLHIAPVVTWSNASNRWQDRSIPRPLLIQDMDDRYHHLMAGRDERNGAALLYFGRDAPGVFAPPTTPAPSTISSLVQMAREPGVHVDMHQPSAWDLPLWIASGKIDSIQLANANVQKERVVDRNADSKPRDRNSFPPPLGNARWSEWIYYCLLNAGIRLPPTAGSGAGINSNPIGYNRVYVYCGDKLDHDTWWTNLRRGQVVVTNGPLMQPRVNGQLPGHVFTASSGDEIELETTLELATRDKIDYLEIVKNGDVVASVRLDKWAASGGRLPKVRFRESGWLLVRAITTNPDTYRFATSGPFHVEIDGQRRISREACEFFLDWMDVRASQISEREPDQAGMLHQYYQAARASWKRRAERSNAP